MQQLQHAFVSLLHAGMDSLIFQQRSLFWFPLFELLFLDSIVSEEHNTSSAVMAYLVNKKKPCFFFLAFVSFFIFLVSLEVVHFSEAAIIIIGLKHDTKRRGGRGAWPFSWFCFLVMLPHGFVKSFGRAFHKSPLNGGPCCKIVLTCCWNTHST